MFFLVFSRKRWFSWFLSSHPSKNHLFSRKRWLRTQKTIFFSRRPKKPSFGGTSPIVLEKMCFFGGVVLVKRLFFGSKPSFSGEKVVFEQPSFEKPSFSREKDQKPSFSREKDGFEQKKPSFSGENQKNHLLEAPAPQFWKRWLFW